MKSLQIVLLSVLVTFTVVSCKDKCKDGEGDKFVVTRNLNNFHTFQLDIPATIDVNYDTTLTSSSIGIFGQKNVIKSLETASSSGIVTVSFTECFNKHEELKFTLNTPTLERVIINASCRLKTISAIHNDKFELRVNGNTSADLVMKVNDFKIEGPAAITLLLNGYAKRAAIEVKNLGEISGAELITDTCSITMSGAGNISTYVTSLLDVTISGSGDVSYDGHDTLVVNKTITGIGTLTDQR